MNDKVKRKKRLTAEQRAEVVAYVAAYNAKHGRGGRKAAAAKYQLSEMTIGNWAKEGATAPARAARAARKRGRAAQPAARGTATAVEGFSAKLRRLATLHEEIIRFESQLRKQRAEFDALRNSL